MSSAPHTDLQPSRLNEKLSEILTICQHMNSDRDLGTLLDLVAREATRLLDADRASIFLLDREKMELWSKVALGSDEILRFDARKGIAGAAALTGKIINVSDAYSDPRFNHAIDNQTGYRTRNLLAVPLQNLIDGEVVGAFEVLNKTPRRLRRRGRGGAEVACRAVGDRHSDGAVDRRAHRRRTPTSGARWKSRYARHRIVGNSARESRAFSG